MNSDRIEQLLRDADGMRKHPSARSSADLAAAVLDRRRSRARRRLGAGVAMLLIGGLIPFAVVRQSVEPENIAIKPTPQQTSEPRDEMAEIQAQIDRSDLLISLIVATGQEFQGGTQNVDVPQYQPEDDAIERAASAVVFQADRLLDMRQTRESATRAYSDVIEHFPDTVSARTARQRLNQIQSEG